jgi:S1-C subfamily serine protease
MKRRDSRFSIAMALVAVVTAGVLVTGCSASFGSTSTSSGSAATTTPTGQGNTLTTVGSTGSTGSTGSPDTSVPAGNATSGTTTPTVQADGLASPAQSVAEVLGPSVVNIKVSGTTTVNDAFGFGQPQSQPFSAEGSGVIYRSDGMIITNNHVVTDEYTGDPVSTIKVTLATGEELDATLVGRDPLTDLAVIKVKTDKQLRAAQFVGVLPQVGEYAIAIGSPLGYENSVTLGIVSGLTREIEGLTGTESAAYTNLIQTDAPISPGNSGGALANASGQVIGINVAYEPPSQTGAVSIGFAIPAATVTNVADQLINSGKVIQGYLGVSLFPDALTAEIQKQYSLTRDSGVLIADIVAGGPGAKAGRGRPEYLHRHGPRPETWLSDRDDRRSQRQGTDHHRHYRGTAELHVDHGPVGFDAVARRHLPWGSALGRIHDEPFRVGRRHGWNRPSFAVAVGGATVLILILGSVRGRGKLRTR